MSDQYEGSATWMRVLFVVLFWIIFAITRFVIAAVAIGQCGFLIFTGKPNESLMQLGDSLSRYVNEILRFVTFNSDQRPFPFNEFPKSDLVVTSD